MKANEIDNADSDSGFWTLQQFWTGLTGKPWYALQKQNDEGVIWQFTGYRHEIDAICTKHSITPEELPPTTEQEFLNRSMGRMPEPS